MRPPDGGTAGWAAAAVDPETGILYIPSRNQATVIPLYAPDPALGATVAYTHGAPEDQRLALRGAIRPTPSMPQGLPLLKPPYSRVTAIDLNTGEHLWWVPTGNGDRYRNHPRLRHLNLPPLGGDKRPLALALIPLRMRATARAPCATLLRYPTGPIRCHPGSHLDVRTTIREGRLGRIARGKKSAPRTSGTPNAAEVTPPQNSAGQPAPDRAVEVVTSSLRSSTVVLQIGLQPRDDLEAPSGRRERVGVDELHD